jgi:chemotaxis family two-component system response regulator Rcp1
MFDVLLVEDNPSDVLLIREAIQTCSVPTEVTIAYDGDQAMRVLDEHNPMPDLVILDLNLPRREGFEILRRITDGGPPMIVFTSSDGSEDRMRAIALGAMDYIVKPVTWDEYASAIRGG